MGPPGVPPASDPSPTPPSHMHPLGPPGPPPAAFGKEPPRPLPAHRVPPPHSAGVPPPNLPAFAPTRGPGKESMQPQSFGFTSPAEIDEEPQPFRMPIPSMQAANVPTTTAFGLPLPLPTPTDEVGSYAAPLPPSMTA